MKAQLLVIPSGNN